MNNLLQHIETETTEFVLIGKSTKSGNKRLAFHPVRDEKVCEEIPFLKETAQNIFSIFNDLEYNPKRFEGLIPNNIIFAQDSKKNGLKLAWTLKSCAKYLVFSDDYKHLTGAYNLPTLLFYYCKKGLKVFAITDQDSKKINGETPLYHAPFFNVNSSGNVCMGNVNLSLVKDLLTFEKAQKYIEDSFFHSQFTHSNFKELVSEEYLLINKNNRSWTKKELKASFDKTINDVLSL